MSWRVVAAIGVLAFSLTSLSHAAPEQNSARLQGAQKRGAATSTSYDHADLIVAFERGVSHKAARALIASAGAIEKGRNVPLNMLYVSPVPGKTREHVRSSLTASKGVKYVANNDVLTLHGIPPNDTEYPFQWGLQKISAECVWQNFTTGSSLVTVAVLDTGISQNHPEFQGRLSVLPGANMFLWGCDTGPRTSDNIEDDAGHGTGVASIAAANADNSACIAGLDWNCRIMPVRVADCNLGAPSSAIINAITFAVDRGARVLNMSFGTPGPNPAIYESVLYAAGKGCVLVATTGNDGTNATYPAGWAVEGLVLSVGASDKTDNRLVLSNYGPSIGSVSVVAPGEDIVSAGLYPTPSCVSGKWGTSYAAPLVSALASLMIAVNDNMCATNYYEAIMLNSGDGMELPIPDVEVGWGRVNACQAFKPLPPINIGVGSRNGNTLLRWDLPWARLYPLASFNVYWLNPSTGAYERIATGISSAGPLEYEYAQPCGSANYFRLTSVDDKGNEGRFSIPVSGGTGTGAINVIQASFKYPAVIGGKPASITARLVDTAGRGLGGRPVSFVPDSGTVLPGSGFTDNAGYVYATYNPSGSWGPQTITVKAECAADVVISVIVIDPSMVALKDITYQNPPTWCVPLYDQLAVPTGRGIPLAAYLVGTYNGLEYSIGGETIEYTLVSAPPDYSGDGQIPPSMLTDSRGIAEGKSFCPGKVYGTYSVRMSHVSGATRNVAIRAVSEMPQFRGDHRRSGAKPFERLKPPLGLLWQYKSDAAFLSSPIVAINVSETNGGINGRCLDLTINATGWSGLYGCYSIISFDEAGVNLVNALDWLWYTCADPLSSPSVAPLFSSGYNNVGYLECIDNSMNPVCTNLCCRSYYSQALGCGGQANIFYSGLPKTNERWMGATGVGSGSPLAFVPHEIPEYVSAYPEWFGDATMDSAFLIIQGNQLALYLSGAEYQRYPHDYTKYGTNPHLPPTEFQYEAPGGSVMEGLFPVFESS